MHEERRRILDMLVQGKITVDEAEKLLSAIGAGSGATSPLTQNTSGPRYLRVLVESAGKDGHAERVNVKVPVQLLRSGMKLAALMPGETQSKVNTVLKEKGINFDFTDLSGNIDELIQNLSDMSIDVDSDSEKVRVFCE